ncbi:hypothetical protein MIND_00757000 [Mycena indigotica]|uniref:Uncharacterized protein n=1 Tax=Mycena indigotica TaxID=2126181 RepID=A0A8H6SLE4_9AGAR|nr:uncharacterized protein MIND_00757000 [Mycena indigotica]KAF7301910.1 hypothetical protein MIND_00757000 [Mycena indigotica]
MPEDEPLEGIEAAMSIPIAPTRMTEDDHPFGFPPFEPSNPLPWNDCYLTQFWRIDLRSPTVRGELSAIQCRLSFPQQARWVTLSNYFYERQRNSILEKHQNNESHVCGEICQRLVYSVPPEFHSDAQEDNTATADARLADSEEPFDIETGWLDSSEENYIVQQMFPDLDPSTTTIITGTFTHDLSTVSRVAHPKEFIAELWAIQRIIDEARPRVEAAKLQAKTEAAAKNASEYDAKTVAMLKEYQNAKASDT